MRVLVSLVFATAALAACGPGEVGPDAGDDDDPDGGGSGSGLIVTWTGQGLDGPNDGVAIHRVRLHLRDLRVVGDAAPGDETYLAAEELDLEAGTVRRTEFDGAPPGMYSALELFVDGGADKESSWEMSGTVELDDRTLEWEIEDDATLPVDLPLLGLDLPAGETRTIAVDLDAQAVVAEIPWESLETKEDWIAIEDDSPLMPSIRTRLVDAFTVGSID